MRIRKLLLPIIALVIFLSCKNIYAFDSNNYKYKSLCGNYEVAGFHRDGVIDPVKCFNDYESAKNFMFSNGADDLAILTKVNGLTKVIDANQAILDLTVNPESLTYYYENPQLTGRKYTYMLNRTSYSAVDGGFLDCGYSDTYGKWTAKVRIANFTGWIPQEAYEIVPWTWIGSHSHYRVTEDSITHIFVKKPQEQWSTTTSKTIGPKPEMLSPGLYYSYDGHYFYKTMELLESDYRHNTYEHAVNKNNPYYNYYQYLSNHSKTTYSSLNLDEYIRNNLGYKYDVIGNTAGPEQSRLYGMGTFLYNAQEKNGVNAALTLSLARNESGGGRSWLAVNKNNGFGLNAVDSNPINGASILPTFQYGIYHLTSEWITYGYAHPRDGRYFGPQYGDKWVGMNVKYASDPYWSETMASLYYSMDKALGLQDYNYYQLGVVKKPTNAYVFPVVNQNYLKYQYPEAEDAVLITGEIQYDGDLWYEVVSDINIDDNYYEKTSGDYNWAKSIVYVKASDIKKINKGKNGYISPNEVTQYKDKNYTYNNYVENGEFKPRVGQSIMDSEYFYDSSLTSKQGKILLKDRYVIIYAQALLNNKPVSYLVTSDYNTSQKHWVSAESIKQVNVAYGKITINDDNNQPLMVTYDTNYTGSHKIGSIYDFSIVPILSSQKVGNETWYKVPVSLTTNSNIYGYTLSNYSNYIWFDVSQSIVENTPPTITATDKEVYVGDTFNPKKDVTAYDQEDGDLTNSITITSNNIDITKAGSYQVTYQVSDSIGLVGTKTITVVVKENNPPVITAEDKIVTINTTFNEKDGVTATDSEDGDLTSKIKVIENTVNIKVLGTYKVVYEVTDSKNNKVTKEIKVEVVKDREPVINVEDKQIVINNTFDPKAEVTAIDPEDGDITSKLKVTSNVDTTKIGTYEVIYEVTDSSDNKVSKTITVEVTNYIETDGEFSLENIKSINNKIEISGSLVISNINNQNKKYKLILKNKNNSNKKYEFNINSWTEDTPYDIGVINGNSYNDSWFKDQIDLSDVPNGDYDLYMSATSGNYITTQLVDNFFNQNITKRINTNNHGYYFNVLNDLTIRPIELQIRNKLYTTSQAPTFRTMVNEYEKIEFKDNKLYLQGYSYNYNGTYSKKDSIERKVIFENINTFEQKIYDVNTIEGPYQLITKDNKDKKYAWYENSLDLSNLEKGTYNILVYTKTTDSEDYGELTDMFKLANGTMEKDGKKYTIKVNKERLNRVEIVVE